MGLFNFIKEAGSSIFGDDDKEQEVAPVKPMAVHLKDNGIDPSTYAFDLKQGHLVITGEAPSQVVKEKVILVLGNVNGVGSIDDRISVAEAIDATDDAAPATEGAEATPTDWQSDTYTVKSGDTLGAIAKSLYGDASKYTVLFEANTPMLSDPNKIYPGQVLRVPKL